MDINTEIGVRYPSSNSGLYLLHSLFHNTLKKGTNLSSPPQLWVKQQGKLKLGSNQSNRRKTEFQTIENTTGNHTSILPKIAW